MRRNQGFTLIEIMVVVAIVAILAAIAIPSYSEYVQRARITEAIAALSDMRNKMEQYYQDNRSWVPPNVGQPCTAGTVAPLPTTAHFTFACSRLGLNTYLVTATGTPGKGMDLFTYTVDQANTRTTPTLPVGWTTSTTCWVLKKDGSC